MNWQDDVKFPARLKPLPAGYRMVQLDSGHYLWVRPGETTEDEGPICWNRWWVRAWAFEDYAWRVAFGFVVAARLLARGGS